MIRGRYFCNESNDRNDRAHAILIRVIDSIDLGGPISAEGLVLPVPAGTPPGDYRERREDPDRGVMREPVTGEMTFSSPREASRPGEGSGQRPGPPGEVRRARLG